MNKPDRIRQFAVGFLVLEALGTTSWWLMLWLWPPSRALFLPPHLPQSVLLSYFLPDAFFFIGAAMMAAVNLWRGRIWAWPLLCAHCGGVLYAMLFTIALCWQGGGAYLSLVLMTPCAVVLPVLVWLLRPLEK